MEPAYLYPYLVSISKQFDIYSRDDLLERAFKAIDNSGRLAWSISKWTIVIVKSLITKIAGEQSKENLILVQS